MITIPPPKDEPEYTPFERMILRHMFRGSREYLLQGRRSYICHALTLRMIEHYQKDAAGSDTRNSIAHELILRRLGPCPGDLGRPHTYDSWFQQENGYCAFNWAALRIQWLESLIKEFE